MSFRIIPTCELVDAKVSEENISSIFRAEDVPPKPWYVPTSPHGITTQKSNMNTFRSG
jgi:hypothetical protein